MSTPANDGRKYERGKKYKRPNRGTLHSCGWCAPWAEVLEAFREGRKDEAAREALRMQRAGEGADCQVGTFACGQLRQEGWL